MIFAIRYLKKCKKCGYKGVSRKSYPTKCPKCGKLEGWLTEGII